jgi:hypothetical protein
MDEANMVQWRNELKVDFTIRPKYSTKPPALRVDKLFLSYRGAYDAVFDVMDRYDNIRDHGPRDFELGKQDLKWENELREGFIDFAYQSGAKLATMRLGRQIIMWGETEVFNLTNIVNPADNRSMMFFSNPDDLATPLWMARFDYSVPSVGCFDSMNFQLAFIPDNRPNQFAPLDGYYNAPYAFPFTALRGIEVRENVPADTFNNTQIAARTGVELGNFLGYLYYLKTYQQGPAVNTATIASKGYVRFDHPYQNMFGASFNYYFAPPLNLVFKGEYALLDEQYFSDALDTERGYSGHKYHEFMLGFEKSYFIEKIIGTKTALSHTFQLHNFRVANWSKEHLGVAGTPKSNWRIVNAFATDYYHGKIQPSVACVYDPEGNWLVTSGLTFTPDNKWYYTVSQMSFWGRNVSDGSHSPFAANIPVSELSIKIGYKW